MKLVIPSYVAFLALAVAGVTGHGYLRDPPMRSSVWRYPQFDKFNPEKNYDDMGLFCGGKSVQWEVNGGKCGTCGDAYNAKVRENEAGGKYAKGIITGSYEKNGILVSKVKLTAYHKGWFEFRLCPNNDVNTPVTRECLDQNVLEIVGNNSNRLHINNLGIEVGWYEVHLQLPAEMTCSQCVLQWLYNTGNSWDCDGNGQCGLGFGPQEQFVNCADIEILDSGATGPPKSQSPTSSTTSSTKVLPTSTSKPSSTTSSSASTSSATATTVRPASKSTTDSATTGPTRTETARTTATPTTTRSTTARASTTSGSTDCEGKTKTCVGAGVWFTHPTMAGWCNANCNHFPAFCPSSHCVCTC